MEENCIKIARCRILFPVNVKYGKLVQIDMWYFEIVQTLPMYVFSNNKFQLYFILSVTVIFIM